MDGSQQYKLNCCLSSFQTDANQFCAGLAGFLANAHQFAAELARATGIANELPISSRHKRSCGMKADLQLCAHSRWLA